MALSTGKTLLRTYRKAALIVRQMTCAGKFCIGVHRLLRDYRDRHPSFLPAHVKCVSNMKRTSCVRRHVPLTKVSQKALSFRDKPWITLKIQRMMAKRDKYLNKFHKTHNLDTEYLYKKFRNKIVF